ncbi:Scyl2 [Scenedesmus sp. PABB004]|nr:Scyl2 [Scenedesmus sp. PABB004]
MAGGYGDYVKRLKAGLTVAAGVAAGAVSRAAEVAKDLAEDLTAFRALKDYKLAGHVASAGPGGAWRVFAAVSKKPGARHGAAPRRRAAHSSRRGRGLRAAADGGGRLTARRRRRRCTGAVFPEASVWILDKKGLMDQASRAGRARGFDAFFELQRRSAAQMVKLKHPGVVKVIEPLEETGGQMVLLTEPVFGSLANVLGQFADVPTAPPDRTGAALSPLEVKYGLAHLAETLTFLHAEAKLAHCNLCPASVVLTRDGGWKLSGFEFVASTAEFGGPASGGRGVTYEYTSAHPAPWEEYCAPPLGYTAPELVGGCLASSDVALSGAADCFSLAALAAQLLTGRQLLPVGSSTGEYRSRLAGLPSADLSGVPGTLQPLLRGMLSSGPAARPNAAAFGGSQWFTEDMLLRCLKFLDTILQRESGQKVAFLKDLATFWHQFDDRLLQHRVLPPIVAEMRSDMVALAALPVVLAIMGRMKPEGFAASGILPVLRPIFEAADGEVLLALVRHLNVFFGLMPSDAHGSVLVPLMLRAFDSTNTRAQEETLKALQRLAPELPYALLRESLMPRVVALCLRTTSLVVRTTCLALMAQAAHRLDKEAAGAMLDVAGQIVAVDRSAGTALAVLRLGEAVGLHYGPELTCAKVLPLLCPLLASPGLNAAQFGAFVAAVRALLDRVAEKTGAALAAAAEGAGSAAAAAGGGAGARAGGGGGLAAAPPAPAGGSPLAAAAGGARGPAGAGWDAALPSSAGGSSLAAGATPSTGAPWSSAAWSSSPAAPVGGGSTPSSATWGAAAAQQQQRVHGGSGGALAPDIFSSGAPSDLLGGLSLGSPAAGPAAGGSGDLFASLAAPAAPARAQPARSPVLAAALKPPPSAHTNVNLLSGGGRGGDPFAGLAAGAAGGDPFASLAGAGAAPPAAAPGDPFASLAGGAVAGARRPQQQQQQWQGGGGGSLI